VLIVVNNADHPRSFAVRSAAGGSTFSYNLPAAAVVTFTWQ
jgi:O-glycosyl hydrolase